MTKKKPCFVNHAKYGRTMTMDSVCHKKLMAGIRKNYQVKKAKKETVLKELQVQCDALCKKHNLKNLSVKLVEVRKRN